MKCTDKVAYKTRGEAYDFAKTVRKVNGGAYIYECAYCHQFHITHRKPERWKFRAAQAKKYNFTQLSDK